MQLTREQWLTEISDLMLAEIFIPAGAVIRPDMRLKLSVGFPVGTRDVNKTIGVCFSSKHSGEGFNEIYISPVIDDSIKVLETLAHEITHAIDDCRNGHRGPFARLARAIGLEGKLTATYAGERLAEQLAEYVSIFGEIPHSKVSYAARKRQVNRQRKVWCEKCGFKFNTSRTQIERCLTEVGAVMCPLCTESMAYDI